MKFSEVITIDKSDDHAKVNVRGERSMSQRSKQMFPSFDRFRTVTQI